MKSDEAEPRLAMRHDEKLFCKMSTQGRVHKCVKALVVLLLLPDVCLSLGPHECTEICPPLGSKARIPALDCAVLQKAYQLPPKRQSNKMKCFSPGLIYHRLERVSELSRHYKGHFEHHCLSILHTCTLAERSGRIGGGGTSLADCPLATVTVSRSPPPVGPAALLVTRLKYYMYQRARVDKKTGRTKMIQEMNCSKL